MNQEEYIKHLGEDDWCYCSTDEVKHTRKTHGQSENRHTSYCQVKDCNCTEWNQLGSPFKRQVRESLPYLIGFPLAFLLIMFVGIPALDYAVEPMREVAQLFHPYTFLQEIKTMDCHELRDWLIESKGTWRAYQTEGEDIFELNCGWLSMERNG